MCGASAPLIGRPQTRTSTAFSRLPTNCSPNKSFPLTPSDSLGSITVGSSAFRRLRTSVILLQPILLARAPDFSTGELHATEAMDVTVEPHLISSRGDRTAPAHQILPARRSFLFHKETSHE